ncbi:MAG: Protoheme IX farnesyltransferase [Phycisphaerae bacterium]|nr:Protoheme IX farnesyltransferase [Phycisphaerae bacterium]
MMIAAAPAGRAEGLAAVRAGVELLKPRLTALAAAACAAGYVLASGDGFSAQGILAVVAGSFLVGGGANALNQYLERDLDLLMTRTRGRPLPSRRLAPGAGLAIGFACALAGLGVLAGFGNVRGAAYALFSLGLYLLVYTPMKRRSAWNTVVGTVPGALPVLIGWGFAGAALSPAALGVFGILVLWQLPHFFAICRLWRDDYARAGYVMWPLSDVDGRRTGWAAAALCAALAPASLLPWWTGLSGVVSGVAGVGLSLAYLACTIPMAARPSARTERLSFIASIAYLPLLMASLVLDRAV